MWCYTFKIFFTWAILALVFGRQIVKRDVSTDTLLRVIGPVIKPNELQHYRYQVALQTNCGQDCGGTIINDRMVLTAAHCVSGVDPRKLTVRVGVFDLKSSDGHVVDVFAIKTHRDFPGHIGRNDIAILFLQEKLNLTNLVSVKLPKSHQSFIGEIIEVSGWGSTEKLSHTALEVIKSNNCAHESVLCSRPIAAGNRTYSGDSGGPEVLQNGSDYLLIASVSGKRGKVHAGANIANLREWIDETIAEGRLLEGVIDAITKFTPKHNCKLQKSSN